MYTGTLELSEGSILPKVKNNMGFGPGFLNVGFGPGFLTTKPLLFIPKSSLQWKEDHILFVAHPQVGQDWGLFEPGIMHST